MLDRYDNDNLLAGKLTDISTAITSFLNTLNTFISNLTAVPAGASLPAISTILYEEYASASDDLKTAAQFEVTLDNQVGSIVTKTTWLFIKKPVVTSMFGLEYRLIDFNGKIEAADVIYEADVAPMFKISGKERFGTPLPSSK